MHSAFFRSMLNVSFSPIGRRESYKIDLQTSRPTATMNESYVAEMNKQADDETVAHEGQEGRP